MSPRAFVLALIMAVLLTGVSAPVGRSVPGSTASLALVVHDPILILGDANLTAANGVTGGTGTSSDPYVISGWDITDNWLVNGIVVRDTTAYLVIRDVTINASYRDVEPEFPRGVELLNVSHVTVERVTVLRNAYAFEVGLGSSNVTFRENVAIGNWVGVAVTRSADVRIERNLLRGGDVPNPTAIMALGINIGNCGAPICPVARVEIVGNTIMNNVDGIGIVTSSGVAVYHNNFVNDTNPASADAPNYTWDDGYPLGGNFWSSYAGVDRCSGALQDICTGPDGIGDTPFTFPTGAEDRYPMMQPWADPSYTVRAPIYIEGDVNFTQANGVGGGSGTPDDPFVITGWQIDTAAAVAVHVRNTTKSFVVRDVETVKSNAVPPYYASVFLHNVTDARIEYVTTTGGANGFWVEDSDKVTFSRLNQTSRAAFDIWIAQSNNVSVLASFLNGTGIFAGVARDLTISSNHLAAPNSVIKVADATNSLIDLNLVDSGLIRLNWTWDSVISRNRIGFGWMLLGFGPSNNTTVVDNEISAADYGIDAFGAANATILGNNISGAALYGLALTGVSNTTVRGNRIASSATGAYLANSRDASIVHNDFSYNTRQAVVLSGVRIQWDAGYPTGGNYWSDYGGVDACSGPGQDVCPDPDGIGDTRYVIDAQDQDSYPMVTSIGSDTAPPTATIAQPLNGTMFTSSPIEVRGTASDAGGSGLRDVSVRVNGGLWVAASGLATWSASVPLAEGANVIEARARDWAGNAAMAAVNVTRTVSNLSVVPILPSLFIASSNGITVTLSAVVSGGLPPYTLFWTFGDGTSGFGASPVHAYARSGTYDVNVTVTDSKGRSVTKGFVLMVPQPTGPPLSGSALPFLVMLVAAAGAAGFLALLYAVLRRGKVRPPV